MLWVLFEGLELGIGIFFAGSSVWSFSRDFRFGVFRAVVHSGFRPFPRVSICAVRGLQGHCGEKGLRVSTLGLKVVVVA